MLWLIAAPSVFANNALQNHPSAYLAMHADDPVDWQLWHSDTLQQARASNQLILVSSGYFSCHWCHVMQQENYKNSQVAQVMNQSFVSVKIDRELNPELDDYLIDFARKTTGRAGWPLHVILTPEGQPIASFIYLPSDQLIQTLNQIQAWWLQNPEHIRRLAQPEQPETRLQKQSELTQALHQYLLQNIDSFSGGLQGTQKFPNSPLLLSLLNQPDLAADLEDWLILTLEQMQNEHLYDHIHGGFFRYTVDPNWQIPHFEKMLYDNAQLARVYFLAAQRFQRDDFLQTARQTLNYIEQELVSATTGLAHSSQSALDAQHRDGGRYLWDKAQLQAALNESEYQRVHQAWLLDNPPPIELGWLPKPINHQAWWSIRDKLAQRPKLNDDKQLLGWNGLLLSAYAAAMQTAPQDDIQLKGHALTKRLLDVMQSAQAPKAINDQGEWLNQAGLEDYALVIKGLQDWQQASQLDLSQAIAQLRRQAERQFFTAQGWLNSTENLLPGLVAKPALADTALPSPSAILQCRLESIPLETEVWRYASYTNPALGCLE